MTNQRSTRRLVGHALLGALIGGVAGYALPMVAGRIDLWLHPTSPELLVDYAFMAVLATPLGAVIGAAALSARASRTNSPTESRSEKT